MTANDFTNWLAEMKSAGLLNSKQDAAKVLGVTDDTVTNYTKRGGPFMLGLACRALMHRLTAYE